MVAQIGGLSTLGGGSPNGGSENHRAWPEGFDDTAQWNQLHPSSFAKSFEDVIWEKTQFGPRGDWGPELSQMVRFMMADTSPCILFWGESHSVIYNEASAYFMADKNLERMGMLARDQFPGLWNLFEKVLVKQRLNGLTARGEAATISVEWNGLLEEICIDWKLIPILDKDGAVKGSHGLLTDLTNSIAQQRQLDHQNRLTKQIILDLEQSEPNLAEQCPLGICRTDKDGYVTYGNDAWRAFYGFTRGRIPKVSQPWLPFLHDDDVQTSMNFFRKLQKCPGPEVCEFRRKNQTFSLSEGGRTFTNDAYILVTGFSNFAEDGSLKFIDFWVADISSQKIASKILSEKMDEAIRYNNQQERFIDMISHEIRNPLSAVFHCGEEVIDDMKDGRATLDTLIRDSAPPATLTSLRQKLKGQLDSAFDAAKTIMYCVQHQKQIVDDVLTLSKLDSDLLLITPSPVELMSLVRSSLKIPELELKATDISLNIVEDDSLEKLGARWVMLDSKRFLQIIINLVTNAMKFTKKSSNRRITVKVSAHHDRPASDPPYGIEYVPQQYRAKEPASGNPKDEVNSPTDPDSNVFLSFSVTDTGLGLTQSQKAHLFHRFAQASPKTHSEYGGSGLGLFISRQITEMLDGQIGVCSTPGVGSTFAFYVKAQTIARPTPTPPPLKSNLETRTRSSPRPSAKETTAKSILVIEDNLINQKVLCKQLKNRGFMVQAANHGKHALETVFSKRTEDGRNRAASFDAILCDIEMPIMDGIEFAKEIRRLESAGKLDGHVPIVGVTANVRRTLVDNTIESGMDAVTTKPYRIHELIEQINRVCPV
ncbi:hypothetical protein NUW58_g5507 [Xylaria curta]|uniref:Uncharacterized protein n=1 Tax=Xylaria curta TaxID=42375 RepID=A0ACC1P3F9_9PEZI|nr:hypothetical protein NUW58_g5507 [Xylaria curta]